MGFKGLSAYMKKRKKYFQDFKLHSSSLVIDGNNIASVLYRQACQTNYIFNGDYDVFAESIRSFFTNLLNFKIKPLVVLDGGYELRKLNAVQARLLHSTREMARLRKEKNSDPFLPLLTMEVFKEVLMSLDIKFAQSRYEADSDIVELAIFLNCPILSSDSDYYFCDARFIPLDSLKFEEEYISCKIFSVEMFLQDFGGLPNKTFLPLLALLLGDYMEIRHFKRLYFSLLKDEDKIKNFKLTDYDTMLRLLCTWFWVLESVDAAVSKIEDSVPLQFKRFLKKQLKLLLEKQSNPRKSPLIDLLTDSTNFIEATLCSKLDTLQLADAELSPPKLISCLSPTGQPMEIPDWFLESEKKGIFSRHVSNILNLRSVLLWTQLESFALPSVYVISFPILRTIAGLVLSISKRKRSAPLVCYVRKDCDISKELLMPDYPSDPISFANLNCLPLAVRQKIFLDALQVNFVETLPQEWALFFLTVIFWSRNNNESEKLVYVGAFVFSFLLLRLADENQLTPGAYNPKSLVSTEKSTKKVTHKAGKCGSDKIITETNCCVTKCVTSDQNEKSLCNSLVQNSTKPSGLVQNNESNCPTVVQNSEFSENHLSDLTHESSTNPSDSIKNESIKYFYEKSKTSPNMKLNLQNIFCYINNCGSEFKELDRLVTHFYAELQTVLQCVMMLNALLNFPYPQIVISKSMSGSLIFRLVVAVRKSSSLGGFVDSLKVDPVIKNLCLASFKFIEDNLSCSIVNKNFCNPS